MKKLNINYNETFGTKHSRDYYRGESFHFSGKWVPGAHYISDDYNIDFVVQGQALLACAKSHLSTLDNEPKDWILDDRGNIVGVASTYWDFVLAGIKGNSPGFKIIDNYWYICEDVSVPEEQQVWVNTGSKSKLDFDDLSPEEIWILQQPGLEVVTNFVNNVITQETGQHTDRIMSQKASTDSFQPKGDYATITRVATIENKIPSEASPSNQLADKAFVEDLVSTNSATFRGTYDTLAELQQQDADTNDYGFVRDSDSAGNSIFKRYKYNGSAWIFEYDITNIRFTQAQQNAIDSGITSNLVDKLNALPNNTVLTNSIADAKKAGTDAQSNIDAHAARTDNPHNVTKAQVGLGNVNNTSDADKPVSTATQLALDNKVDKVTGKQLSTEDYTTEEKQKLASIASGAEVNIINEINWNGTNLPVTNKRVTVTVPTKTSDLTNDSNFPVDANYVHTDSNFTAEEKSKLSGIATGAEVNVQSDWNITDTNSDAFIKNKPTNLVQDASYVHTDNNYTTTEKNKLSGIATSAQVNVLEGVQVNGTDLIITNKKVNVSVPTALSQLSDDSTHRVVTDTEKSSWNSKYSKPSTGIPASDIASGVIPDVSAFITKSVNDLTNYYTKSQTYTQTEVNNLIGAINQFKYEIAASTSVITNPQSNVLYLIGPTGSGADKYEEYVYPNSTTGWVKIGDTSIDLSSYVTTTALNTALASYTTTSDLTTLLSAKVDKVSGKGLSTNDYTTAEKTKLAGIAEGAQVNKIEHIQINGTEQTISNKTVNLPAYPTTLPASDVYTWAKQSTKPSYNLSEIGNADDVKAIENLTGTSGYLKKTGSNTWTLNTTVVTVRELGTVDDELNNLAYGIQWTKNASTCTRVGNPLLHRTLPIQSQMKGCIEKNGEVIYWLDASNWAYKENGDPSVLDGTDGYVRTYIPKFYGKSWDTSEYNRVMISPVKIDDTWVEIPEHFEDSYESALDRINLKLCSVMNTTTQYRGGNNSSSYDSSEAMKSLLGKPVTNIARSTARTYAANAESELLNLKIYKWIFLWLPVIEYCNFDLQTAINANLTAEGYHQGGLGSGATTFSPWSNYNGYNPIIPCGLTNSLGNGSGQVGINYAAFDSYAAGTVYANRYRGLECPFGDVWTNLDGVIVDSNHSDYDLVYTCDDASKYGDSITSYYTNTSKSIHTDGYVKEFDLGSTGEITAISVGGGKADYHYTGSVNSILRTLLAGGAAHNGGAAGPGCLHSSAGVSYSDASIGFRSIKRIY